MADFNIRTDAVDVEQIMRQIRARIESKRGVDYTEEQIQELASVKLEHFLDPKGVRSDLVEQFRRARDRKLEPFEPEQYAVDANDLYGSSRGFVRFVRKLFNPILKLLLNTNRLVQVLHQQASLNRLYEQQFHDLREKSQQRDEVDVLYYELVHNLVLELTRVGIENRNLKMRLESLSSRMDFDERRARALETVVQYRPGTGPSREPQQIRARPPQDDRQQQQARPAPPPAPEPVQTQAAPQPEPSPADPASESNTARRRRRRRRGRRGGRGRTPGEGMAADGTPTEVGSPEDSPTPPHGDPTADAALDEDADNDFDDGPTEAGSDTDDSGEEPDPSAQ
jgi:CRISPR/Cas system CSM-associated protein Csm2 small subunit